MKHEDNGNRDGKNDQEIAEHAVISHSSSGVRIEKPSGEWRA
jgi:hypothetical protein